MPAFVNSNPHAVRVMRQRGDGTDERLVRLVPGEVVEADGAFADALCETPGVETADSGAAEAWQGRQDAEQVVGAMPGDGSRISAKLALGPIRAAVRIATVAAPLRRVVGDDSAPMAPVSGRVTTKDEMAQESAEHARAFGPNEARPGDEIAEPGPGTPSGVRESGEVIHNAQVENAELAEEMAHAFIDGDPEHRVEARVSGAESEVDESAITHTPEAHEPPEGEPDAEGEVTVPELRRQAKERGLPVSGTKAELQERLAADPAPA